MSSLDLDEDQPETRFPNRCGRGILDAHFDINDGDIHEDLLTEKNIDIENEYWKERKGSRYNSRPYYFEVVE